MKNIAIVLGYGVYQEPNPNYKNNYLVPVLDDILHKKIDLILTCAGASNPKYAPLTEADSIKSLFIDLHPELEPIILTETESLSTPESLQFASRLISSRLPSVDHFTIYVDSCRVPKAFYLSLDLFLDKVYDEKEKLKIIGNIYLEKLSDFSQKVEISYQNMTVVGIPLSDSLTLVSNQIISSMLEMHSFDYPDLHQQFIDWRKKQWGIK